MYYNSWEIHYISLAYWNKIRRKKRYLHKYLKLDIILDIISFDNIESIHCLMWSTYKTIWLWVTNLCQWNYNKYITFVKTNIIDGNNRMIYMVWYYLRYFLSVYIFANAFRHCLNKNKYQILSCVIQSFISE